MARSCEHENPPAARFCGTCGVPLFAVCSACGGEVALRAAFCSHCGHKVEPEAAPEADRTESAADEVAGERRRLTVMFCDLVGSTELAARLDPEEFRDVVDEYYRACGEAIRANSGHVANYVGDGLLAYFGYPIAFEDSARRAVLAGLAVQDAIADLNRHGGVAGQVVDARVGIHTGLVVIDLVGGAALRETHALGSAVNIAARVEGAALAGEVCITGATKRLLGGEFELEDLGRTSLKGVAEPMVLYRAVGRRLPTGTVDDAGTDIGLFAGREHECELMLDRWARAREGRGQVVLVLGEPGIGKSRLVRHFRGRAGAELEAERRWLVSVASAHDRHTPFAVISGLCHRRLGGDEVPAEERRERLDAMLRVVADEADEGVELIGELLGLPGGDEPARSSFAPHERRARLIQWLALWLSASAGAGEPVVLVLEDVHWADPSSLEVLTALVDQVQRVPALLVMTARPEFAPPWKTRSHHAVIALPRLTTNEIRVVVGSLMPQTAAEAGLIDAVVARSDCVPLFA
jgi:class 3 adenylate cyclase